MSRLLGGIVSLIIIAVAILVPGTVSAAASETPVDAGCTPRHPHFIPTRALDEETAQYTDDLVICANEAFSFFQTELSVRNRTDLVWTVAQPPDSTLIDLRGSVKSKVFHEGMESSTEATFIVPGESVIYTGDFGTFTDIYNRLFMSPEPTLNLAWLGWSGLADAAASKTRSVGRAAFARGSLTRAALWDCASASYDAGRTVLASAGPDAPVDPTTFASTLKTSLGFASGASTCAVSWGKAADDLPGAQATRWRTVAVSLERRTTFFTRLVQTMEGFTQARSALCIVPRIPC